MGAYHRILDNLRFRYSFCSPYSTGSGPVGTIALPLAVMAGAVVAPKPEELPKPPAGAGLGGLLTGGMSNVLPTLGTYLSPPKPKESAHGGIVKGEPKYAQDTTADDTEPHMLSPGEMVIPKTVVAQGGKAIKSFAEALLKQQEGSQSKNGFASLMVMKKLLYHKKELPKMNPLFSIIKRKSKAKK